MNAQARILVVEDNTTSRKLFRIALESEGYFVVEAADASSAIETLSLKKFDIVLQDLVLPDMHGFELVGRLRALPNGADVPILAVSGFLSRVEEAQATEIGFTALLVKPVEPARLIDAVRMFLPKRDAAEALRGNGRTILIANDDPVQLKLACLRLQMLGFLVLSAVDGANALALAREHDPDVILSDVLMPEMDGFELCLAIRSDPATRAIPLVLISAHYGSDADQALARRVGANALLQGTPEFAEVPPALAQALAQGAPVIDLDPTVEIELDHAGAIARQLERQLMAMGGLSKRCTLLSAEVSLLSGVASALARQRDPAAALKSVLASTLDAAGISKGALYLREPDRHLRQHHAIGFGEDERAHLNSWVANASVAESAVRANVPLTLASTALNTDARQLLEGIGVKTVQIIPLVARSDDFGLLILGARHADIISHDAADFAGAFASQIVQALELARAFEQTSDSERRFRQIAENVHEMFFLTDPANSTMLYVSPAYERIWGRSCQSMYESAQSWLDAVHPEDIGGTRAQLERMNSEGVFAHSFRVIRPDGATRWVSARCFPILDENGKLYRIAGVAEDVTERMLATENLRESEMRFRQLAENILKVFFLTNADNSKVLYVSPAYEQVWGRSCASLYADASSWAEPIHPDDRERILTSDRLAQEGHDISTEYRIVRADGSVRWIAARGFPVRDETGAIQRIAAIAEDITERKQQEQKIARLSRIRAMMVGISSANMRLRDRGELFREVCRVAGAEGLFPMVWIVGVDADSRAFTTLAAHGEDAQAEDFIRLVLAAVPNEQLPASQAANAARPVVVNDLCAYSAAAPIREDLLRRRYLSGAAFPLFVGERVVASLVLAAGERDFFDAEEVALLDWLAADLSFALEHLQQAERLEHLAYFDALTGLPNARLFRDRLEQFVNAAREGHGEVCVAAVDLIDFTRFNEQFGRSAGDELLHQAGDRLAEFLVEPYTLGRISADTFMAASPHGNGHVATELRDRILSAFARPFSIDGRDVQVGAQAGIAFFPGDGGDVNGVFKSAEAALKLAKSSGESYVYYSSEMNARIAQHRVLEEQLRAAVAERQFVLHYQPRVDLISGELAGAEALIRWQHPQRGLVAPADFIGLAEETGLIVPIGAWVIETVCAQLATWIAAGATPVPIAVNLSAIQMRKSDLQQTVSAALKAHAVDARLLDLELTESAIMADPAAAAETLKAFRALGVGLALDDFGTGYSSLAQLKRFPFTTLKIDRAFVTDITSVAEDAAIANAIIAMAHGLELKVVAEGVENEGQMTYLRAHGCDELQGNYFSPAVPLEVFDSYLRDRKRMALPVPSPADRKTLLIVDDEPGIRSALNRALRGDGYHILTADGGAAALDVLAVNAVQVIISDQRMPGMSGTEFLNTVKQLHPDTVRIILSGYTDLDVVTESVNRGAVYKFLTKPWDDHALREQVRDAFRRYAPDTRAGTP